jgi:hypothetical protein
VNRRKVVLLVFLVTLSTAGTALAQGRPTRGEVVVLGLDTSRAGSATEAFIHTDKDIRDVLATIGQFQVAAMAYHVSSADLAGFARSVQGVSHGSANAEQPIHVGEQLISAADASRMAASSVIVAPSVVDVQITRDAAGLYTTGVITSFAFVAPALSHPPIRISIDTHGIDRDRAVALNEAVDAIPPRLASVLDEVPYLRPNWGIIEVRGNEVVLELGRDAGIRRGDEFLDLPPDIPVPGAGQMPAKGLLKVRQVDSVTSIAGVIYSDSPPRVGDRLLDLARVGMDSTVYVRSILAQTGPAPGGSTPLVGLRQSFSRGFYLLRPFVGIEVPFNLVAAGAAGVPVNLYAGGEYDIRLGRLQLVPRAAIGLGASTGLAGPSPDLITHVGGGLSVAASYFFTPSIKAEIETGWLSWTGFSGYSYDGAFLGGGFTVMY